MCVCVCVRVCVCACVYAYILWGEDGDSKQKAGSIPATHVKVDSAFNSPQMATVKNVAVGQMGVLHDSHTINATIIHLRTCHFELIS